MPIISVEGIEARNEAKKVSKGFEERVELRAAIGNLAADQTLRLQPAADESLRKLKVMARRAAKEVELEIKYGESPNGQLLVWLATSTVKGKRGRPRKAQVELSME